MRTLTCVSMLLATDWLACVPAGAEDHATPDGSAAPELADAAAPTEPPPDALAHYARGRALYLEGRYREAVSELTQALASDPTSPELTFNVARVYELLGDIDRAIHFYERYRELVADADPADRARVDATLTRLRGARFHTEVEVAPPRIVTITEKPPVRGVADAAFWSVGGLGVSALVGATASGTWALLLHRKQRDFVLGRDGSAATYDAGETRLRRLAVASDVLSLAGSSLTVSALLLYILRTKPAEISPPTQLGMLGSRDTWLLTLRGAL